MDHKILNLKFSCSKSGVVLSFGMDAEWEDCENKPKYPIKKAKNMVS